MELTETTLQALEKPWASMVRKNVELLDKIYHAINGPFHIIHPETFAENLRRFDEALVEHDVLGRIFFGKKANKSGAWLRELVEIEGAVDAASVPEISHSLANGVRGQDIGVTGAAKSNELLWLAGRHDCLVAIDSLDELTRALNQVRRDRPLRILLRILPPTNPNSRFGLNAADLEAALLFCVNHRDIISMRGFSFHLDGYAVKPRAELALHLIDLCIAARERGLIANSISIGGGFACRYIAESDWLAFNSTRTSDTFHAGKKFSHFYPYYQSPTGSNMLRAILSNSSEGSTLADKLRLHDINLFVEPGRALLDGAGISVFPVQGFKRNAAHGIVTVGGLSMSISEQWKHSEFLPAPVLVQRGPDRPQKITEAAIGGSSCMEYDMLTWRKVKFPAEPRYGDYIIYMNTAGYQMDKNESKFHQLPLPPKVVLKSNAQGLLWSIENDQ